MSDQRTEWEKKADEEHAMVVKPGYLDEQAKRELEDEEENF